MQRTFTKLLLRLGILFCQNSLGCLQNPYITFRKLATSSTDYLQAIYLFGLTLLYFAFASLVRTGLHNPYLLTLEFNKLVFGGILGFLTMITLLFFIGKLVGGKGTFKTVSFLWAYTLLPTIIWFFMTSFFFVLLPPPRTEAFLGKLFSVVFFALSLALFSWKLILFYLTLRFGMKLDLLRIGISSVVIAVFVIGYSMLMYELGIFRIPFL